MEHFVPSENAFGIRPDTMGKNEMRWCPNLERPVFPKSFYSEFELRWLEIGDLEKMKHLLLSFRESGEAIPLGKVTKEITSKSKRSRLYIILKILEFIVPLKFPFHWRLLKERRPHTAIDFDSNRTKITKLLTIVSIFRMFVLDYRRIVGGNIVENHSIQCS